MIDYSGLSKERLIEELHETDDDLFFLQEQLVACMRDRDEDLRAIQERQKRERDEFRITNPSLGEIGVFDEFPQYLAAGDTIEHRRVTDWQEMHMIKEAEDVEGN